MLHHYIVKCKVVKGVKGSKNKYYYNVIIIHNIFEILQGTFRSVLLKILYKYMYSQVKIKRGKCMKAKLQEVVSIIYRY